MDIMVKVTIGTFVSHVTGLVLLVMVTAILTVLVVSLVDTSNTDNVSILAQLILIQNYTTMNLVLNVLTVTLDVSLVLVLLLNNVPGVNTVTTY
jgi:hypothetical protein